MSFIKRAQEAAAHAAAAAQAAGRGATDPSTMDKINRGLAGASSTTRDVAGMARRGVSTVIERIDPGTLAEVIIKATALQEMTNKALRKKGSPYRIAEISISASIPPAVSFAISRLDDEPEAVGVEVVSSSELVELAADAGDLVLALDGTIVDEAVVAAADAEVRGAMPPSGITSGG